MSKPLSHYGRFALLLLSVMCLILPSNGVLSQDFFSSLENHGWGPLNDLPDPFPQTADGKNIHCFEYLVDEDELNAALNNHSWITLPFDGFEFERFRVLWPTELGSDDYVQSEKPTSDYEVWPLVGYHCTGIAVRKNGHLYFQFYGSQNNAKDNYQEFNWVEGQMYRLCHYTGANDINPADNKNAEFWAEAAAAGVSQDYFTNPPDGGIFDDCGGCTPGDLVSDPDYSPQSWQTAYQMQWSHIYSLRGGFMLDSLYVAKAETVHWLHDPSETLTAFEHAVMTITWSNTILLPKFGHRVAINAFGYFPETEYLAALNEHADTNFTYVSKHDRYDRQTVQQDFFNANVSLFIELLNDNLDFRHGFYGTAASVGGGQVCGASGEMDRGVTGPSKFWFGRGIVHGMFTHEFAHTAGVGHTFNFPDMGQRSATTSREVGGGSSFMGYVTKSVKKAEFILNGVDTVRINASYSGWYEWYNSMRANDTLNTPIVEYYNQPHPNSILQLTADLDAMRVNQMGCGVPRLYEVASPAPAPLNGGTQPVNYIPHSTPFVLSAEGVDGVLYAWDQDDAGGPYPDNIYDIQGKKSKVYGPIFRRGLRTRTPVRYFPDLDSLLKHEPILEHYAHPTTARTITFDLTAENNPEENEVALGLTLQTGLKVHVQNTGPFEFTASPDPSSPLLASLQGDGTVTAQTTIEWDVAETDQSPISCQTVSIYQFLGHNIDDKIWLGDFPNNGSATVDISPYPPTLISPGAYQLPDSVKLLIKSPDHIFFAVSDGFEVLRTGCTDPLAANFDPLTNFNDPNFPCEFNEDVLQCGDPVACNYVFGASNIEGVVCVYPTCIDPASTNNYPYEHNTSIPPSLYCPGFCTYDEGSCSGLPVYFDESGEERVYGFVGRFEPYKWEKRAFNNTYTANPEYQVGNSGIDITWTQGADLHIRLDGECQHIATGGYVTALTPSITTLTSRVLPASGNYHIEYNGAINGPNLLLGHLEDFLDFSDTQIYLDDQLVGSMNLTNTPAFDFEAEAGQVLELRIAHPMQIPEDSFITYLFSGLTYPEPCITGCMNPSALNFDPAATVSNPLMCDFLPEPDYCVTGDCEDPYGGGIESMTVCGDPEACNYVPLSNWILHDGEKCRYPGCQDFVASNFDPSTLCEGTCCLTGSCGEDLVGGDGLDGYGEDGRQWPDEEEDWADSWPIFDFPEIEFFEAEQLNPNLPTPPDGCGLVIEANPEGMAFDVLVPTGGPFRFAYRILSGEGPQPAVEWSEFGESEAIETKTIPWEYAPTDMAQFCVPPAFLPAEILSGTGISGAAETMGSFYQIFESSGDDAAAKFLIGPTPAGSTPPTIIITALSRHATCNGDHLVSGCTDPDAGNYNPTANLDDNQCEIGGCNDESAINYDASAQVARLECLFAGNCNNNLMINDSTGFGFTGSFAANLMTASHPDHVAVIAPSLAAIQGPDAGSAATHTASWTAPANGFFRFAWAFATDDNGLVYDKPFVQLNGGDAIYLSTADTLEAGEPWILVGGDLTWGFEGENIWEPSSNFALPLSLGFPFGFNTKSFQTPYMGVTILPMNAGDELTFGVESVDGLYGEGILAIAGPVWTYDCPEVSASIPGCTNANACNFDAAANEDDGSCLFYGAPCDDGNACTFNDIINDNCGCVGDWLDSDADGTCDAEDECPENPALTESGSCGCQGQIDANGNGFIDCEEIPGCLDDAAVNFNPEASWAATCLYAGPCNAAVTADGIGVGFSGPMAASEWLPLVADGELASSPAALVLTSGNNLAPTITRVSYMMPVSGVVQFTWAFATDDELAVNEDGSLAWDPPFYAVNNGELQLLTTTTESLMTFEDFPGDWDEDANDWVTSDPNWLGGDGSWTLADSVILPNLNQLSPFNSAGSGVPYHEVITLTLEAGDVLSLGISTQDGYGGSGTVAFAGFLYPVSCNEPAAIPGCTYAEACNFSPEATTDDGSCIFAEPLFDCNGDPLTAATCDEDVDGDGMVGVNDLLLLLAQFGDACSPQ